MVQLAPGWTMDVERGPGWLFVRLHGPEDGDAEGSDLAARIWALLEEHFTRRLVLELDDVAILRSYLLGQLVLLHKRICSNGGLMRLSGLSPRNRDVLETCRLHAHLPHYPSREDAVMGRCTPRKPR